jgi:hypothetical protein
MPAARRVLDGVVDQIDQRLLEAILVRIDCRRLRRNVAAEHDARLIGFLPQYLEGRLDDVVGVQRDAAQRGAAELEVGQGEQIVDPNARAARYGVR